MEMNSNNVE